MGSWSELSPGSTTHILGPTACRSPENYHTTLAQYYGVPMVSVRAGFYHAFRKGGGAFSNLFQEYPPDSAHGM